MIVKVMYEGHDEKLDAIITNALLGAGLLWYAQGYNLITKERDLSFDYKRGGKG